MINISTAGQMDTWTREHIVRLVIGNVLCDRGSGGGGQCQVKNVTHISNKFIANQIKCPLSCVELNNIIVSHHQLLSHDHRARSRITN